jgi:hypothetical protein
MTIVGFNQLLPGSRGFVHLVSCFLANSYRKCFSVERELRKVYCKPYGTVCAELLLLSPLLSEWVPFSLSFDPSRSKIWRLIFNYRKGSMINTDNTRCKHNLVRDILYFGIRHVGQSPMGAEYYFSCLQIYDSYLDEWQLKDAWNKCRGFGKDPLVACR